MFKNKIYKYLLVTFSALIVFNIGFAESHSPNGKAMPWIPMLLLDGGVQEVDRLVYVSDEGSGGVYELYLVSSNKPGVPTKLNPKLVNGGDVSYFFHVSPDGSQVAYIAEQEMDNVYELYLVDLSKPGVSTKLNAPLADGWSVHDWFWPTFAFNFDGSRVAYITHDGSHIESELNFVDLDIPGVATVLNASASDINTFSFVPGETNFKE